MKIRKKRKNKKRRAIIYICVAIICLLLVALFISVFLKNQKQTRETSISDSNEICIIINDNVPYFTEEEKKQTEAFEVYSDLDHLGRCGVAYANVCKELMPTEERGSIGDIKPTGWVQEKYPGVVDSSPAYLYNRSHLLAYCLTGENANEKNLITGTRYFNVEGMLPFEEQVAKYLDNNDNHVLYRVTPDFQGDNMVASGVLMEAYSVEDGGKGVCFCVYVRNIQPDVIIDYRTGESRLEKE